MSSDFPLQLAVRSLQGRLPCRWSEDADGKEQLLVIEYLCAHGSCPRSAPFLRIVLVTGIMRLLYVMHRHAVKGIAFLACSVQVVHKGFKPEGHARACSCR